MKKKIVKGIFKLFIFLIFVATAISSLLFAKGLRFDSDEGEFIQTGILDMSSVPLNVAVFLNDEFIGYTPDFLRGIPLDNIAIRFEKGGFRNWGRIIKIDKEKITRIYPVLIPKHPEYYIKDIARSEDVLLDNDKRGIVVYNPDLKTMHTIDFISEKEEIYDIEDVVEKLYFDKEGKLVIEYKNKDKDQKMSIFKNKESLLPHPLANDDLKMSSDGKYILIIRGNDLWKFEIKTSKSFLIKKFDEKIENATWFAGTKSIIVSTTGKIKLVDFDGKNEQDILNKDVGTSVYLLTNNRKILYIHNNIWKQFSFLDT